MNKYIFIICIAFMLCGCSPPDRLGCHNEKDKTIIRYGKTCSGKAGNGYFVIPRAYIQSCNVKNENSNRSHLGQNEQKLKLKIPLKDILPEKSSEFVELYIAGGDSPIGCSVYTGGATSIISQTIQMQSHSQKMGESIVLMGKEKYKMEKAVIDGVERDLFFNGSDNEIVYAGFCQSGGICTVTHNPMSQSGYAYGAGFSAELKESYFEIVEGVNRLLDTWYVHEINEIKE